MIFTAVFDTYLIWGY